MRNGRDRRHVVLLPLRIWEAASHLHHTPVVTFTTQRACAQRRADMAQLPSLYRALDYV
jgi:hypothetical protein